MTTWLWVIGTVYILFLVAASYASWSKTKSVEDYLMAGSSVGVMLGFLTFAATLFSTFTLMGMPDFFRNHGVGAWIFLAVSDGVAFFMIIWFGFHLRRRVVEKGFRGVSGLMNDMYGTRGAGYVYFTGVFLFLVPYVAIQVRGIALFLSAVFPEALPAWGWSLAIVVVMLIYSEIGGLRAIIYSDVLQGLLLLGVTWIIAVGFLDYFGGVGAMFSRVEAVNTELLSTPGPQGLFTVQFLIASLLAIVFIPITQPQLTTRMVIMKDTRAMYRMAVAVGVFAMLVILPTTVIGMYGAIHYADASTADFLSNVLLFEQADAIAAAVVVGLIAAAMSTADSQIFALGTELRSLLRGDEQAALRWTKVAIAFFALAALVFSLFSSDEFVLLARVSFAGTSLLGPMVLAAVFARHRPGTAIVWVTALGLLIFIGSLAGVLPEMVGPVRMDLLLLLAIGLFTLITVGVRSRRASSSIPV